MAPQSIGPYQITHEIARGGMGVVYRGVDTRSGRPVALKALLSGRGAPPAVRQRFQREVEALVKVSHPHVVKVLDAGEAQGCPWIALALVEGPSLQEVLDRSGPLPVRQAVELALKLAQALEAAHGVGVIHRDLKPANVLLDPDGEPRLTDFGLAKDLDPERSRLSQTGQFMGSPGYMPPEQARGDTAAFSPASDVYGLGATLLALVSGQPPFSGASLGQVLAATVHQPPPLPSAFLSDADARLDAICSCCLAKSPDDRYPTMAALALDLERYLNGESVSASGPRGRAWLPGALVGAALIAGLGAGAAALIGVETATPPAAAPQEPPAPAAEPPPAEAAVTPLEAARLATAAEPGNTATWLDLIALLRASGADAAVDQALAAAEQAVGPDPLLLAAKGDVHLSRDELEQAREAAEAALAANPRCGPALYCLAEALRRQGTYIGALEAFDAALRVSPTDYRLFLGRSRARHAFGDTSEAQVDREQAIKLAPPEVASQLCAEQLLESWLEDTPQASGATDTILALDPSNTTGLAFRAFLTRESAPEAARADVIQVAQAGPDTDPRLLYLASRAATDLGDMALAFDLCDRVIEATPPHESQVLGLAHDQRARLHSVAGELEEAILDHDVACQLATPARVRFARSETLHKLKRFAAAERDLLHFLTIEDWSGAWRNLAFCRVEMGDREGALTAFRELKRSLVDEGASPTHRNEVDRWIERLEASQ